MERDIPRPVSPDERRSPTHPLVVGRTKPVVYQGIEAAWAAEELQHANVEPIASADVPNIKPFGTTDPVLEEGVDWV